MMRHKATLHLKFSSVMTALVLTGGLVYFPGGYDFSLLDSLLPREGDELLSPQAKPASHPKQHAKKDRSLSSLNYEFTFFDTLSDTSLEKYLGLDGKVISPGAVTKKSISHRQKPDLSRTVSGLNNRSGNFGEYGKSIFTVQAGSFKRLGRASGLVEKLKEKGYPAFFSPFEQSENDGLWYRVYLGTYDDHRQALRVVKKAQAEEDLKPIIIFNKE